jgi:hypothetical protein
VRQKEDKVKGNDVRLGVRKNGDMVQSERVGSWNGRGSRSKSWKICDDPVVVLPQASISHFLSSSMCPTYTLCSFRTVRPSMISDIFLSVVSLDYPSLVRPCGPAAAYGNKQNNQTPVDLLLDMRFSLPTSVTTQTQRSYVHAHTFRSHTAMPTNGAT